MLKQYIPSLLYPSLFKRSIFFILSDILIIILSLYLSFLLRFEFALADEYRRLIAIGLPFLLLLSWHSSAYSGFTGLHGGMSVLMICAIL